MILYVTTNKVYKHSANLINFYVKCDTFHVKEKILIIDFKAIPLENIIEIKLVKAKGCRFGSTIYERNKKIYATDIEYGDLKEVYDVYNIYDISNLLK